MKNKITVTLSQESYLAILDCVRSDIKGFNSDIDRYNEASSAELELYGFGG